MDATTLNVMPMEVTTSAPEATLPVEQQAGITTPDRVSTPPGRQNTTDSSSMATLATPPEAHNALNYNFNHQLPTPAPDDILAHLTTVENNIPDTPAVDPAQNYFRVYVALTLEEFQLLSQQQTTPIPELNYNLPIHDLPSDIRMPIYDSLPLHLRLSEAGNFYYYNLTSLHLTTQYINSMVIVQLHLPQEVLLRFVSAGQVTNFSRDYVSHMISITDKHHLPTRQLHQRLHRINYDLDQITTTFNLSNNFIWTTTCPCTYPNYSTTSTNHNNFKTTTTSPSTRFYTKVPPTTASPYSRLRIFPRNTNYYSTTFSLQPAKHLHHRSATTTVSVADQTSSTHSLPTTMQAWTTASAKSRTTESTTGLSTPDLQVELQLLAVLRHRTTR